MAKVNLGASIENHFLLSEAYCNSGEKESRLKCQSSISDFALAFIFTNKSMILLSVTNSVCLSVTNSFIASPLGIIIKGFKNVVPIVCFSSEVEPICFIILYFSSSSKSLFSLSL